MAGRTNRFQRSHLVTRKLVIASRRSPGMAAAPAMTLNRMYHCAPNDISTIPPMFKLTPNATNAAVANGNRKFAGKLART
jgi:hypothetical protein